MNAEEVMENLEALKYCDSLFGNKNEERKSDDAIKLLRRGEKYEVIVEDIKQYIIDRRTIEENFVTDGKDIIDLIKWLKQNYFPKSTKEEDIKKSNLEKRIEKLEKDSIIFSNEQYGNITQKQLIKKLLSKLGLRIETSSIPAKEEIREFELKGKVE